MTPNVDSQVQNNNQNWGFPNSIHERSRIIEETFIIHGEINTPMWRDLNLAYAPLVIDRSVREKIRKVAGMLLTVSVHLQNRYFYLVTLFI